MNNENCAAAYENQSNSVIDYRGLALPKAVKAALKNHLTPEETYRLEAAKKLVERLGRDEKLTETEMQQIATSFNNAEA